jgi:hypothetical protein
LSNNVCGPSDAGDAPVVIEEEEIAGATEILEEASRGGFKVFEQDNDPDALFCCFSLEAFDAELLKLFSCDEMDAVELPLQSDGPRDKIKCKLVFLERNYSNYLIGSDIY